MQKKIIKYCKLKGILTLYDYVMNRIYNECNCRIIDTLEDKIEKLLQNEEEFRNNQDLKNN
jgi:hypothetical protein